MNKWMLSMLVGGLVLGGQVARGEEETKTTKVQGGSVTVSGNATVTTSGDGKGVTVTVQEGEAPGGAISFTASGTGVGRMEKSAYLGVSTSPLPGALRTQLKLKNGLVVDTVEPGSPAEAAGLKQHDIIEKLNDQWLMNPAQLAGLIRMEKAGEGVTLTVIREGEHKSMTAKLDEREMMVFDDDQQGGVAHMITGRTLKLNGFPGGALSVDLNHAISIEEQNGQRILTVKDGSGKTTFSGPIDTAEQRKLIPEEFRKQWEELDQMVAKVKSGETKPK